MSETLSRFTTGDEITTRIEVNLFLALIAQTIKLFQESGVNLMVRLSVGSLKESLFLIIIRFSVSDYLLFLHTTADLYLNMKAMLLVPTA